MMLADPDTATNAFAKIESEISDEIKDEQSTQDFKMSSILPIKNM